MIIEKTQRGDLGFEFLKAGVNGRKTNCGRLNPAHATGHENYKDAVITKFICFGQVAEDMNNDWSQGYRLFKIERGGPRDNRWVTDEGELRVSKEMIVREYKALKKGMVGTEQAELESETVEAI